MLLFFCLPALDDPYPDRLDLGGLHELNTQAQTGEVNRIDTNWLVEIIHKHENVRS